MEKKFSKKNLVRLKTEEEDEGSKFWGGSIKLNQLNPVEGRGKNSLSGMC